MFTKLVYHFDCDGKKREEALILSARDVRSESFCLESATYRSQYFRGDLPCLHIVRRWSKQLKTDPYNEDGRPPTLMGIIVLPHVTMLGKAIEIFGFERPNMCWAGHPRPAYDWQPALKVAKKRLWPLANGYKDYTPGRYVLREAPHDVDNLPRQKVVLR